MGAGIPGFATTLIPDGPLHPGDAVLALVTGFTGAVIARRRPGAWVALAFVGPAMVAVLRHGAVVVDGYTQRPSPLVPVLLTAGVGLAGLRVTGRPGAVVPATIAACAAVWSVVPDTEMALAGCGVLVGLSAAVPRRPSRLLGLLPALAAVAAVVGTVGRPAGLLPATVAGFAAFGSVLTVTHRHRPPLPDRRSAPGARPHRSRRRRRLRR